MSRAFSISLAAMMLLLGVISPGQQLGMASDVSFETTPMSEDLAPDKTSDLDEAVEAPADEVVPVPAEDDAIATGDNDLAPIDEPAENANSPPAEKAAPVEDAPEVEAPEEPLVPVEEPVTDVEPVAPAVEEPVVEEPVVEEAAPVEDEQFTVEKSQVDETSGTTDVQDDTLISPSAVDPNPGDCGGIDHEPCPGGGGEQPETTIVTITVTQSGQVSVGATVVVRDSANVEVASGTTGANGVLELQLNVGDTYLVNVSKTGFKPRTGVSHTVSADSPSLNINLLPEFGRVTVTVTNSVTGEPVRYGIVRFTKKPGSIPGVNTNSGSTGQISVSMESGEYVAFFSHPDYVSQSFDVTVTVGDSIPVKLVPKEVEPVTNIISLLVVDSDTGEPIPNATVTIRNPQTWAIIQEGSPDANGRWESASLTDLPVRLEVGAPYHFTHSTLLSDIPSDVVSIELDRFGEASLTIRVTDVDSGLPIEDALITMVDEHTGVQVGSGRSDAMGNWASGTLPGAMYTVTIQADGYQTETSSTLIRSDHTWNIRMMPPGYAGSVLVWAREAVSDEIIVGATVTVRGGEETQTFTTNEYGFAGELKLAPGTWEVTIEANGYQPVTVEEEIRSGLTEDLWARLEPLPGANLTVQLQAPVATSGLLVTSVVVASNAGSNGLVVNQVSGLMQPITAGQIQMVNPDTGRVIAEGTTDDVGFVTLAIPRQGTYQLSVSVPGYEGYSAPYNLTQDAEFVITLQPILTSPPVDPTDPSDPVNPGTGDPGDGSNPGTGDPDTGSEPDPGVPGADSNPGTGEPGNPAPAPAPGGETAPPVNPDPVTGGENALDPEEVAQSDGSVVTDPAAPVSGSGSTDSDATASAAAVNQLPETGAGSSHVHLTLIALTLLAGTSLLSGVAIRRR